MPTNETRNVSHAVVGLAAAAVVPKITGQGLVAAMIGAVIVMYLHELMDAPVARAMVSLGLQL